MFIPAVASRAIARRIDVSGYIPNCRTDSVYTRPITRRQQQHHPGYSGHLSYIPAHVKQQRVGRAERRRCVRDTCVENTARSQGNNPCLSATIKDYIYIRERASIELKICFSVVRAAFERNREACNVNATTYRDIPSSTAGDLR